MAELHTRIPRIIPRWESDLFDDIMQEFAQKQAVRGTTAAHWDEIAELILPTHRNTFYFGNVNTPGEKKTQRQVDANGAVALSRFAAICNSLITPRNMTWHGLQADDDYVMKDRDTKLYFEQVTKVLFKHRYSATSGFSKQNTANFLGLGAFGNFMMLIDDRINEKGVPDGLRYKSVPVGKLFFGENAQGIVDNFIRWERMTARQIMQRWPDKFPDVLYSALDAHSETLYDILQRVCPRSDYQPDSWDDRRMLYRSTYICLQGRCVLQDGGYRSFPGPVSRYENAPDEVYGRSVASMVLPALKTLNAEKTTFLKQGHRAADPVLLTADDGLIDLSLRPGALNKGGVNADGKAMVHVLPTGEIQISKEMMQEEKSLIQDVFLVTLFQILTETPTMSATEVIERTNEKGILLAPTVGAQQDEYLAPMIHRELDLLSFQNKLPPMPPRLKEAGGEYSVVYSSPLSRAMRAQESAGFWRTVDQAANVAKSTGDPSVFDSFDFEVALPATAEINGALTSWMADDKKVAAKQQARAKQQQTQNQIQAGPAQAALMKARVAQTQAGMGPDQAGQPSPGGQ